MRMNIENASHGGSSIRAFALGELVRNLKELRDRTDAGDMSALTEFFDVFRFNDNQHADRAVPAQPVRAGLTDDLLKDIEFAIALAGRTYPKRAEAISLRLAHYRALSAAQRDSQPDHIADAGEMVGTSADARDAALDEVHKFLLGEGPLDGLWYGDVKPDAPTKRYWWRTPLRAAIAASREAK